MQVVADRLMRSSSHDRLAANNYANRKVDSYPSSPLPPHVFGVRDKVCVLCCLSTVTLTGVCRREYHMYISKLKYKQKLTEIWTLNPNPQELI